MTFQFAWVDPTETTFTAAHQREDEEVFAFRLEHTEGDFPMLSVDVRNPRRQLLAGTDIWTWLSQDGVPLFFGRLVAIPEEGFGEIVTFNFIARPLGYDAAKHALADTLRVAPYWDPVWIVDGREDDPDVVLEARTQLWHIDRVTHAVTASDILRGEDGTIQFGQGDVVHDSLDVSYGSPPVRRVRVEAEVSWDQAAVGTMDISPQLVEAFHAAGSAGEGLISSFTGQGLEEDWPEAGKDLKGGWSIDIAALQRADGVWVDARYREVAVDPPAPTTDEEGVSAEAFLAPPYTARFYLWEFRPTFILGYDVSRARVERIAFDLVGDVQRVFADPGEEDQLFLTLASRKVSEPLPDGGPAPIGDVRRRSYIKTDRGRRSLEYLIALARSKLLARARAAEVSVQLPFDRGVALSCRRNVTILDGRLPGGYATGKVIGYTLRADGSGEQRAEVKIGCTIGMGAAVAPVSGTASYGDDYGDDGWQTHIGETVMPIAGEVTYGDLSAVPVADDGIDFFQMWPVSVIQRLEVINGETAQEDALDQQFPDIPAAVEALNAVYTEVWLELRPLVGGPFETDYDVELSRLMVPRTIEL